MYRLAETLSQPVYNKKVYRYTNTVRNPFPGSAAYQVSGHAVDLLYFFGNYIDRFATQRARETSIGFVTRFIRFAYGEAPWDQYTPEERKIAVADGRVGWVTRTREEDERISKDDEIGERRYAHWDVLGEVLGSLGDEADRIRSNLIFLLKD